MGKKLNELAGEGSDTHLVQTIRDSAANIWLAGLGAFAKAQEEGGKLFEALVKEGEAVQNRTSKQAQEAISDVKTKATGTWDKLEQVFVDRVARALHSLDVPTKNDIDALSKRVHELTKVAEKLSAKLDEEAENSGKTKTVAEDAEKSATKKASPRAHS
ncbi:phasin family protein [Rhodomicrobium vannielii ATCC 17100]|uniref:phasin family protein n=1 Tax=Rhodomicrobium vannielii TaxID=1069 RepID=UPI0019191484|nr:phasin family protein [Rhodomicrobium vannielii]MBJ7532986.1 phasin family protein [Rhodomicrobium vannielii ATCC 17100]